MGPFYNDLSSGDEFKVTFTTDSKPYFAMKFYFIMSETPVETICEAMLLKGKAIPLNNYFVGISSLGEAEYNYSNEKQISLGYIGGNDGMTYSIPSRDDGTRTLVMECDPNTTYTITKELYTERFVIATTSEKPINGIKVSKINFVNSNNNNSATFTTPKNAKYLLAYMVLNGNNPCGKVNVNKSCIPIK